MASYQFQLSLRDQEKFHSNRTRADAIRFHWIFRSNDEICHWNLCFNQMKQSVGNEKWPVDYYSLSILFTYLHETLLNFKI